MDIHFILKSLKWIFQTFKSVFWAMLISELCDVNTIPRIIIYHSISWLLTALYDICLISKWDSRIFQKVTSKLPFFSHYVNNEKRLLKIKFYKIRCVDKFNYFYKIWLKNVEQRHFISFDEKYQSFCEMAVFFFEKKWKFWKKITKIIVMVTNVRP